MYINCVLVVQDMVASELYGVNAAIIIFLFYCIVFYSNKVAAEVLIPASQQPPQF